MDPGVNIAIESIIALIFMLILAYLLTKSIKEKNILVTAYVATITKDEVVESGHIFGVLNEKYAIMKIGSRYYSLKQVFYDNLESIIQVH